MKGTTLIGIISTMLCMIAFIVILIIDGFSDACGWLVAFLWALNYTIETLRD